jgi:hypothetical protein
MRIEEVEVKVLIRERGQSRVGIFRRMQGFVEPAQPGIGLLAMKSP